MEPDRHFQHRNQYNLGGQMRRRSAGWLSIMAVQRHQSSRCNQRHINPHESAVSHRPNSFDSARRISAHCQQCLWHRHQQTRQDFRGHSAQRRPGYANGWKGQCALQLDHQRQCPVVWRNQRYSRWCGRRAERRHRRATGNPFTCKPPWSPIGPAVAHSGGRFPQSSILTSSEFRVNGIVQTNISRRSELAAGQHSCRHRHQCC